jgi:hypothetical protein
MLKDDTKEKGEAEVGEGEDFGLLCKLSLLKSVDSVETWYLPVNPVVLSGEGDLAAMAKLAGVWE